MPKPPTRQTPTPRFRVVAEYSAYIDRRGQKTYHVMGPKGCRACCRSKAMADRVCRALNASRSKGKP